MMISQPAWWCLEATWQQLVRRPRADLMEERLHDHSSGAATADRSSAVARPEAANATEGSQPLHVAPTPSQESAGGPLTATERRARAAALRALALSRGRRFDAARAAFTDAARLDPALDLTRTPNFWKLERAAHEAAIDAYVAAGRDRDAAVLRARVRSTFRPKAVRPRHEPVLTP